MRSVLFGVLLTLTGVACHQRQVSEVDLLPAIEERTYFPLEINRDLDLLFVIDDSRSMAAEQAALTQHFHNMIEALETLEGGLPNIHIGVVSTDLGIGGADGPAVCSENGKRGVLQAAPGIEGCQPPDGGFIVDVELADGSRQQNYTGELADTFACIATLGTSGCGFEQPLEAMRMALDENPDNEGFLRDGALLGVVFLGDEDDCSTFDHRMFGTDGALGVRDSFRCFEYGVECEGDENPREPGERTGCVPRRDSPFMYGIDEYVEFLRGLKQPFADSRIFVAGMIAEDEPVRVVLEQDEPAQQPIPALEATCRLGPDDEVGADPPVRLQAFIDRFRYNTSQRICDDNLADALQEIGLGFLPLFNTSCVRSALRDTDPDAAGVQPECVVEEIRLPRTELEARQLLPRCDDDAHPEGSSQLPCYRVEVAPDGECPSTPQGLKVAVYYASDDARDPSIEIDARCVAE